MMINRSSSISGAFLAGALAFAVMAAPARAEDVMVKHAQGETAIPLKPAKVLTFDLATLDTLTALGIDVAGVPGGKKPDYLSKYESDDALNIGTLFEPDFEAVNAAEPDLIVVAGRSAAKYGDLSKIATTIDLSVDTKNYLGSAEENIRTLGKIFDKENEAEALLAKLRSSTAALQEKAAGAGKGLLLLTTGGKMSTYGPGSRFGVLFTDYGIQPADENIKIGTHGQPASFEYILERNPDWLFVIDRDAAIGREGVAAQKFLDNEIVGQTTAWKKGQAVYLNGTSWYLVGGGITALQTTVDQLSEALGKN
jgi:iron complex transport system substrate-binding protein